MPDSAPPPFSLTYQDYLGANPQNQGGSEAGSPSFLSEAQWNALSPADQWRNVNGGISISSTDPRFAGLSPSVGGDPSRGITVQGTQPNSSDFVDPSHLYSGSGFYAFNPENLTPDVLTRANAGGLSDRAWALAPLAVVGGGLAYGALAGDAVGAAGAADAAGTGAFDVGGSTGFGGAGFEGLEPGVGYAPGAGAFDAGGSTGFGGVTPLDSAPGAGPADAAGLGLDTSPLPAVPPAGDISPLADLPTLDGPAFADSLTPGIDQAIANYPAGPDSFMPPDTPEAIPSFIDPSMPDVPMPDINVASPSFGDQAINALTRDPLRTLGTAATVGSLLANHPNSVPPGFQGAVQANGPLADQARGTLQSNGAPTDAQRGAIDASIDQQWQVGREQIIQTAVNAGQGGANSMVVQDKLRQFRGQLETQRQTLYLKQADQNMLIALKELGLVDEQQYQLAQMELQQDNLSQQRAISIMQSLGFLWSQGSKPTAGGTGS